MTQSNDAKTFVTLSKNVTRMADLAKLVDGAILELGFDFYAFGHHVDLQIPPKDAIQLINYPAGWYDRLVEQKYYVDDPVLMMAQRSASGFAWEDLPRRARLSTRQKAILQQAPREGMGKGFTFPIHVPGEYWGSCNFGVRPGRELPEESLPFAQFISSYTFEAARRIRKQEIAQGQRPAPTVTLSPRQRDCVVLIARGLTDKEIARLLSIKPDTVHEYIEDAKQRYRVKTRHQLVVHALFEGELAFADALASP